LPGIAKPGDAVTEDQLIVEVMTDKAAVEVPAPVSGRVVSITGGPGDKVAVGSTLIVFEVGDGGDGAGAGRAARRRPRKRRPPPGTQASTESPAGRQGRVMASPGESAAGA